MRRIVIDAGHGIDTPGKRTPAGEREWTFNDKVARAVIENLNLYKGIEILRVDDVTGKRDIPLKARTNLANGWNSDVYISIHHNAFKSVWGNHGGIESYTMDHPKANAESVRLAKLIHPRVVKAMGLRDRGIKRANLHVLRETNMPAVLIEGGFMDSLTDINALRNDEKLEAQGRAIAEGLAKYFKLALKTAVINKEKAESRVSDTHSDAWAWATKEGYLNGERPGEYVTREQLATILKRYDDRFKE